MLTTNGAVIRCFTIILTSVEDSLLIKSFQGHWCIWGETHVHSGWLPKQQGSHLPCRKVKKKNSHISGSANWSQFHPGLAVCGVRKHRRLVTPLENWGWQKCGCAHWRTPGLRIFSAVFSFISFCSRALSQMYNSTHGSAWWQGKPNYYLNHSLHTKITRRSHASIVGIMHWNIWFKEELHC